MFTWLKLTAPSRAVLYQERIHTFLATESLSPDERKAWEMEMWQAKYLDTPEEMGMLGTAGDGK